MIDSIYDLPTDLGQTLVELRNTTDKTQADVAQKLNIDQSRVSRIEKGSVNPTVSEIEGYLSAIGTENAKTYCEFLKLRWVHLNRPSFWHPQRDELCKAETSLQKLENFKSHSKVSKQQLNEAQLYGSTLLREAKYLSDINHSLAFVGKVGIGKTTTICKITGLFNPEESKFNKQSVLATGKGRTTACEVHIRRGKKFGIVVHPLSEDETNKVIEDFWTVWKNSPEEDQENEKTDVSWEVERALRNMIKSVGENTESEDPLLEIVNQCENLATFRAEIFERLKLSEKKQVEFWFEETSEEVNCKEIKEKFKHINYGQGEERLLPQQIDVIVPNKVFQYSPYESEIIDTRGVDVEGTAKGAVIRQDLIDYLDNPRTLTVLCCKFDDAPGDVIYSLIDNLSETREEAFKERVIILVIPHNDEALETKDNAGDDIEEEEEAYKQKQNEVQRKLRKLQKNSSGFINLPILFFNASSEKPSQIIEVLNKQLERLRLIYIKSLLEAAEAIDILMKDVEEKNAREARKNVIAHLNIFLEQHSKLPPSYLRVQDEYLLDEMNKAHPRKVLATVRRRGSLDSLNFYVLLGNGSRNMAWHSSKEPYYGLRGIIDNLLGNSDLKPAHSFLKQIKANWIVWRENFLKYAEQTGKQAFQFKLEYNFSWADCAAMYGQGGKFRNRVINQLEQWFDASEQQQLHDLLNNRLEKAWQEQVLNQLRNLTDEGTEAE